MHSTPDASPRPFRSLLLVLVAAAAVVLAACGDGETATDPTPPLVDDGDDGATVPADDDGAIGEPDDEDSQTDEVEGSGEDVVPSSSRARVIGDFGDMDIDLLLTEDSECAIGDAPNAGDEPAAEVNGSTTDGETFRLDWSVDEGELSMSLDMDGTEWTADPPLGEIEQQVIRLTRNGEVYLDTTFESSDGDTRDALLYVNCQPVT